jgi:hypothetical protein
MLAAAARAATATLAWRPMGCSLALQARRGRHTAAQHHHSAPDERGGGHGDDPQHLPRATREQHLTFSA